MWIYGGFTSFPLAKGLLGCLPVTGNHSRLPTRISSLWKDADPNIPVLKQAKAEYAKLN